MLPVMKALKHGLLIDLFRGTPWCAASKAVQIIQAQEKLLRVLHPVDTKFKLVHVMFVKMDSWLVRRREAAACTQIERHRSRRMCVCRSEQRKQEESKRNARRERRYQLPSLNMFHRYTPRKLEFSGSGRQRASG